MISPNFKLQEFLDSVLEKDYIEILFMAQQEARDLDQFLEPGVKGVVERRRLVGHYRSELSQFLWFMNTGSRPGGVDPHVFQSYRPICEALIRKGQFKASALSVFEDGSGTGSMGVAL